jgi:hypothetical protein
MPLPKTDRPSFFEGQYLGSADLMALVDYARDLQRAHGLGPHSWGIWVGLEVATQTSGSTVEAFVMPGVATDIYSRIIVVPEPAPIPAEKLLRLPTGLHMVWLRFQARSLRGLRPGFETCDAEDRFSRVREAFAIEVGPRPNPPDQSSGVTIAGAAIVDPRTFLQGLDPGAPVICDASVPYQAFPDDRALGLIPVGMVAWQAGAAGKFVEMTEDQRKTSRSVRRNAGAIAETVYASDGIVRIADRRAELPSGKTIDELCTAQRVKEEDLVVAGSRFVGSELFWIEGHTRARGDVRLWGTRLELRDKDGQEADAPLWLRRAPTASAVIGGQDLQMALGKADDGKTRLTIGPKPDASDLNIRAILQNDGKLGLGKNLPTALLTPDVLVAATAEATLALATPADTTARISFTQMPTLTVQARVEYDKANQRLVFGHGDDPTTDKPNWMTLSREGKLGVRIDNVLALDPRANDIVIKSPGSTGITLLSDPTGAGWLMFAEGTTPAERTRGWISYDQTADRLDFATANAVRASLTATGGFEVRDVVAGTTLRLDSTGAQALSGGASSTLALQSNGGGITVHASRPEAEQVAILNDGKVGIGRASPSFTVDVSNADAGLRLNATSGTSKLVLENAGTERLRINADTSNRTLVQSNGFSTMVLDNGRVGIAIGASSPIANLHVAGTTDGAASLVGSHVALIENTAGGSNSDVLALRVNRPNLSVDNNFITFFSQSDAVGRIEATSGGGVAYESGSADFAESLPRAEHEAPVGAARVVGIRRGRVVRATENVDALAVTSDNAAFVGNAPSDRAARAQCETITFVGQVDVLVEGPAAAGDFVVPSGRDDGVGRAVSPSALSLADAGRIVGRVWQDSSGDGMRRIRVAVGAPGASPTAGLVHILERQETIIETLKRELARLTAKLGA